MPTLVATWWDTTLTKAAGTENLPIGKPEASTDGSVDVTMMGVGRVCATAAGTAPIEKMRRTPTASARAAISWQAASQRVFGSVPARTNRSWSPGPAALTE